MLLIVLKTSNLRAVAFNFRAPTSDLPTAAPDLLAVASDFRAAAFSLRAAALLLRLVASALRVGTLALRTAGVAIDRESSAPLWNVLVGLKVLISIAQPLRCTAFSPILCLTTTTSA